MLAVVLAFVCAVLTIGYFASKVFFASEQRQELPHAAQIHRRIESNAVQINERVDKLTKDTADLGQILNERISWLERRIDAETNKDTR
jgi:sensor domain CHASE-containing protein